VNLTGEVYNDLNGNGNLDPGDPGLQGWTVNLLDSSGNLVATTTSDANGNYEFDNLFPGTFTIEEILQNGWTQTQPVSPNDYTVTIQSGTNETGLNFGNFKSLSVSGNVYNDQNGDGLKNSGEQSLPGWTVNLLDSSGNVITAQTTDSSGNYTFTGVGPGSYQVAEVVQANWVQTQPLFPTVYTFSTKSGHNLIALNFGDHAASALNPTQVIDNGQTGYSETGSWNTATGGFNGTNRVTQTTHGSGSTATATWSFTGLAAGSYDVYVTFATKSVYSKAAPFSVADGGTGLGTQLINESILVTQAQGGRTQGSYGGVGWLELGTYSISSGTLNVVLGNNASGNSVDADGVLIVAHAAPVAPHSAQLSTDGAAGAPIGTLDQTQPVTGPSTKKGSSNGTTSASTVAISGVTQANPVTVVYSQAPAQSSNQTTPPSMVDLALSQNGNGSTQNGNADVIASLAADLLAGKKVIA